MPTGYTEEIAKGITFQEYAMGCARAFGACITMRDEPSGTPIPDKFEPSDYHAKALAGLRERLEELKAMTPDQAEIEAGKAYDTAETVRLTRMQELAELRQKYDGMLKKAQAWTPPTLEHKEFKRFMCGQIEQSINFDCDTSYYETPTDRKTGPQWLHFGLMECARQIAYHEKEHAAEVERAEKRTGWLLALRQSFGQNSK